MIQYVSLTKMVEDNLDRPHFPWVITANCSLRRAIQAKNILKTFIYVTREQGKRK